MEQNAIIHRERMRRTPWTHKVPEIYVCLGWSSSCSSRRLEFVRRPYLHWATRHLLQDSIKKAQTKCKEPWFISSLGLVVQPTWRHRKSINEMYKVSHSKKNSLWLFHCAQTHSSARGSTHRHAYIHSNLGVSLHVGTHQCLADAVLVTFLYE